MQPDDLHINLPFTPFPMEAHLGERLQPEILQKWRAMDIYRTILENQRDAEPFILHDGPPYASGDTHIGIGFNKILKDIIVKHWTMRGKRVPFVPGWDCHGLPIETQVLRELADQQRIASLDEIRERCASHAMKYIQEQKDLFQRLGVFGDWNRPYQTMDFAYEAGVLEVLSEIVRKGYAYQGRRPVYWCHVCKTVLADAEVELVNVDRPIAWVYFVADTASTRKLGVDGQISLVVPTREVWTLISCVALALEPDAKYALIEKSSDGLKSSFLLVREDAISAVRSQLGLSSETVVKTFLGREISNLVVKHPITQQSLPILAPTHFNVESNTGAALVIPAHDLRDFQMATEYGLEIPSLVDESGEFTTEAGADLAGQNVREAEPSILNWMRALETLADVIPLTKIDEPHGSRCGHVLIIRATRQWFISLEHKEAGTDKTLRERAIDEVDNLIHFVPQGKTHGVGENRQSQRSHDGLSEEDGATFNKNRLLSMIKERPDWCISRQRNWGIPIPVLDCCNCGRSTLDYRVIQQMRDLVALEGSRVWYTREVMDFIPEDLQCGGCRHGSFERGKDRSVLDVWFESSTSWFSALVADSRLSFPADLCVEGNDQHRGWFQLSLLTSIMVRGKAPFRTLLTHGFVLDKKRQKMSKRLRNFVTLKSALEGNDGAPADLIRLYFVWHKNITRDLPLSVRDILELQPVYLAFRNCFKYLLGNLNNYAPNEDAIPLSDLCKIDQWILFKLYQLIEEVTDDYEKYRFHDAIEKLHTFCNNDLSKVYFDIIKDRLYSDGATSYKRRSAQTALHSILITLVKMLAPVLVYTCEEVWQFCPGISECASVHLALWPDKRGGILNPENTLENQYEQMLKLRRSLQPRFESARQTGVIGSTIDATLTLMSNAPSKSNYSGDFLRKHEEELREFLTVSELRIVDSDADVEPVMNVEQLFCRVEKCSYVRCLRCRKYDETVGRHPGQLSLCARCVGILEDMEKHQINVPEVPITPEIRPALLAHYLKSRGIRKIAILNEGDKCIAYHFHRPSQRVVPHRDLQPLADFVCRHADFRNHAAVLLGLGEHTDALFGIGIHSLDHGTPLGGTREFTYRSTAELLENLLRLSYAMSIKNSIGDLPHGGGKSIIDTCELDLKVHRELRRRIYRDFGQFTASLFGRYICAEDIGNTTRDTRQMLSSCRHVMCLPEVVGGSGNPSRFTGLVGWLAARAGWEFLTGSNSLDGLTVAIQGAGQVGQHFIDILTEGNPGRILIADKERVQIEQVKKLLHRKGFSHLVVEKDWDDPLRQWENKPEIEPADLKRLEAQVSNYILYSECDVLIPVAVGKVIYPSNVPFLRCKLIVPIANNTYSDNDLVSRRIWERGIVDVVENNVNWGGAAVAASELYGYDEDHVIAWCLEKAFQETSALLKTAKDKSVPPWEILKERATDEISHEHPIVEIARKYHFIGRINENFCEWIKTKWLPNIFGVDADNYARYVVEQAYK